MFHYTTAIQEFTVPIFFDNFGTFIPTSGFKGQIDRPDRAFKIRPPGWIKHAAIIADYEKHYPGLVLPSAAAFRRIHHEIVEDIRGHRSTANLLKGPSLPICLPAFKVEDYGEALEKTFLPAVKHSYEQVFPERVFVNRRAGTLEGQVKVETRSRHQRLISLMGECPVVGLYFPTAFQGFSIHSDREAIGHLPEDYLLSGGIDAAVAFATYPQLMARDFRTVSTDCAAVEWQDPGYSLCFNPSYKTLEFGRRDTGTGKRYSGGLIVIRPGV